MDYAVEVVQNDHGGFEVCTHLGPVQPLYIQERNGMPVVACMFQAPDEVDDLLQNIQPIHIAAHVVNAATESNPLGTVTIGLTENSTPVLYLNVPMSWAQLMDLRNLENLLRDCRKLSKSEMAYATTGVASQIKDLQSIIQDQMYLPGGYEEDEEEDDQGEEEEDNKGQG